MREKYLDNSVQMLITETMSICNCVYIYLYIYIYKIQQIQKYFSTMNENSVFGRYFDIYRLCCCCWFLLFFVVVVQSFTFVSWPIQFYLRANYIFAAALSPSISLFVFFPPHFYHFSLSLTSIVLTIFVLFNVIIIT